MHRASLAATIAATLVLGCDSGGPSTSGDFSFTATLDGAPWVADTGIALAFAAPTDTSLTISAARRVSPTEEQEITVFLMQYGRLGQSALGDAAAPGMGAFSITQISNDSATGFVSYLTDAREPGLVSITAINRADSTISGTFAFTASTHPDTIAHRRVTGYFRVRYSMQTVIIP